MKNKTYEKVNKDNPVLLSPTPIKGFLRSGVVGLGLVHGIGQAATIEVTSKLDDGTGCTLREAVMSINDGGVNETGCVNTSTDGFGTNNAITFADSLDGDSVTLTQGQLQLNSVELNIDAGNMGITVNADNASRVFEVISSTLTLNSMTLTGGSTAGNGGGLYAYYSTVGLNNSTVSGSSAMNFGGGLYAYYSTVELTNSTISGNSAENFGGGLYVSNATVGLTNSTISGNSSSDDGGGLFIILASAIELNNSTVSDNLATGVGDGLYIYDSTVTLSNSIIANSGGGDDVEFIGTNTLISDTASILEENIILAEVEGLTLVGGTSPRTNVDPGFLPLADNGGSTQTHALIQGSIASNTGILPCPVADQRGVPRDIDDGVCDVGAFELGSVSPVANNDSFFVIPLGNGRSAVVPL